MNNIIRILDANINRVSEGLRVIEEITRFILEDDCLFMAVKIIRHDFKSTVIGLKSGGIYSRNSMSDIGKSTYSSSERSRAGVLDILRSNAARSEEGLRVLEEFSKISGSFLGKTFKSLRFRVYDVESKISNAVSKQKKLDFDLYVVTQGDHIKACKSAIDAKVKIIQLRDKAATRIEYYKYARQVAKICKKNKVTFIVNDHADICVAVDADGIHIGQEDLPVKVIRKILGPGKIIGVSTHSLRQAVDAQKNGADYISIGPVFETPSKPGWQGLGLKTVKAVLKKVNIPVVAIGGINEDNVKSVVDAGVKRAAVIRAVENAKKIRRVMNAKK